ncbi:MAG: hypothetical protein ACO1QR_05430 [Chthoniobacteraceae bacterium]
MIDATDANAVQINVSLGAFAKSFRWLSRLNLRFSNSIAPDTLPGPSPSALNSPPHAHFGHISHCWGVPQAEHTLTASVFRATSIAGLNPMEPSERNAEHCGRDLGPVPTVARLVSACFPSFSPCRIPGGLDDPSHPLFAFSLETDAFSGEADCFSEDDDAFSDDVECGETRLSKIRSASSLFQSASLLRLSTSF